MKRIVLFAATIVLTGCSSHSGSPPKTSTSNAEAIKVGGSMEIQDPSGWSTINGKADGAACFGSGGFDDIGPTAQVVITDNAGKTVAIRELGAGRITTQGLHCRFPVIGVTVKGKSKFYGVQVGSRGVVTEPRADLSHVH